MADLLLLWLAQFSMIYLLGFQSLVVRDGNVPAAMTTSMLIGLAQFQVLGVIPQAYSEGLGSAQALTWLSAGPIGIAAAIKTHPLVVRWWSALR